MLMPAQLLAAQSLSDEHGVGLQQAVQWSLSLVCVLLIFFMCVWLFRKSGRLSLAGAQKLRILTGLSLGMREKVVLIKAGDKELLLGVTPGRIEKLLELHGDERLYAQADMPEEGDFSVKLKHALRGQKHE